MARPAMVLAVLAAACGEPELEPDAQPPVDADYGVDIAAIPSGCTTERSIDDRPDDHRFDQIRVLYVTTADGPDLAHDTSGKICNSIRAIATWFHAQSGAYLRFDTVGGLVDIGFARLELTDAEMAGTDPSNMSEATGHAFVRNRIELGLGVLENNKMYAVYYEGSSFYACGGGAYPPLIYARVGAVYLRAGLNASCGYGLPWGLEDLQPHYVDYATLHEVVHGLGLAPNNALHEHSTGHVYDPGAPAPTRDLMYSPRPGMPDGFWSSEDPGGLLLDIGNDDYYNTTTPLDLSRSSLLAPLPPDAHRPGRW